MIYTSAISDDTTTPTYVTNGTTSHPYVTVSLPSATGNDTSTIWPYDYYEELEALMHFEAIQKTREWVRQRTAEAQLELSRLHSLRRPIEPVTPLVCRAPRLPSRRRSAKAVRNWRRWK